MLKLLRLLALCLAPLSLLAPLAAQTLPAGVSAVRSVEGIDEYRLANGLQILLVPDDSKPTTTVNLTYRVGSRHENIGETGMAHLLEHMLFKGSPKHPKVWAEFTKRGLAANGSTSFDRTNYTASFSANDDNLQWYLGWLADSMVNSHVARADLDTEMTVVRNEMESGENNPSRMLIQRTMAAAYDWHPYGRSVIGARSDVENVDIPRLQAFYRLYYQPDNATLIVSGKFEPQRVLQWVAASFGPIPKPTRTLPAMYTLDAAQDGERQVTLRRSGGAPLLMAAYHVPAGSQADFAAVELLAQVLGDTPAGRLHKQLTEKQLAASTFAFAWSLADPAVLMLGAGLAPGQDVEQARGVLLDVGEAIAKAPITDDELKRARTQWLNGWEQTFTDPENVGPGAVRGHRHGRLAAVLPGPRPGAAGDAGRRAARRRGLPAAGQPHPGHVPADRRAAARAGARQGRPGRHAGAVQAAGGRGHRGRLRRDAGEHRRAHPALRGRRAEGRGAGQADARRRGAGGAEPALRRREDAVRPGRGGRSRGAGCSTRARPRCRASRCRTGSTR